MTSDQQEYAEQAITERILLGRKEADGTATNRDRILPEFYEALAADEPYQALLKLRGSISIWMDELVQPQTDSVDGELVSTRPDDSPLVPLEPEMRFDGQSYDKYADWLSNQADRRLLPVGDPIPDPDEGINQPIRGLLEGTLKVD